MKEVAPVAPGAQNENYQLMETCNCSDLLLWYPLPQDMEKPRKSQA
jgi:hypothetical protein